MNQNNVRHLIEKGVPPRPPPPGNSLCSPSGSLLTVGGSPSRLPRQLVDECFALVGSAVLAALADPLGLAKITVGLLGMTTVGLVIANAVSLGGG